MVGASAATPEPVPERYTCSRQTVCCNPFQKKEREEWLVSFLEDVTLENGLLIGYAYYDASDGILDVLNNDEYHTQFAEVAIDLMC